MNREGFVLGVVAQGRPRLSVVRSLESPVSKCVTVGRTRGIERGRPCATTNDIVPQAVVRRAKRTVLSQIHLHPRVGNLVGRTEHLVCVAVLHEVIDRAIINA